MVYKSVWHLLGICKVNTWNTYRCNYSKLALPSNKMFALCQIANESGKVLMHANKASTPNQGGRPSKPQSSSIINAPSSKREVVPTPGNDIRYNKIGHCQEAVDHKREM